MSDKIWKITTGCFIGFLVLILFIRRSNPEIFMSALSFPVLPIAEGLRILSLKGGLFNIAAWIFYLCISAVPLSLIYRRRKKERKLRELLLPAATIFLLVALYHLMNPQLLPGIYGWFGDVRFVAPLLGGVFYSVMFTYFTFTVLEAIEDREKYKLFQYGQWGFFVLFLLLVFDILGTSAWQWLSSYDELRQGNTALGDLFGQNKLLGSQVFLFLGYLLSALPSVLTLPLLYRGARILKSMEQDISDEETRRLEKLGEDSVRILKVVVLASLSYHLLQLFFIRAIQKVSVTLLIPVLPIITILSVYVLTVLVRENKELKEDNDLFI